MKTFFTMLIMMIIGSSFSYSQDRDYTMIMNRKEARPLAFRVDAIDSLYFTQEEVPDSLFQLGDEAFYYEEVKYDSLFRNDGFINYTGTINHYGEGFTYTDLIDISHSSYFEVFALMNNPYGGGISLYDTEGHFMSSIFNTVPDAPYGSNSHYRVVTDTLPQNTAMIRVQSAQNKVGEASVVFRHSTGPSIIFEHDPTDIKTATVKSTRLPISLELPDIRHFYTVNFRANVSAFDTLTITRGKNRYSGTIIQITNDSVFVILGDSKFQGYSHGLKINEVINVSLNVESKDNIYNTATLSVRTKGGINSRKIFFRGCCEGIIIDAIGELSNPYLDFYSEGLKKDVWLFGDSYLDYYADSTLLDGHLNISFDGYSGRAAYAALSSIKKALNYSCPKYIVWAMGMNDKESGAMNSSWLESTEEMLRLCQENDITPILCTIPNVPYISHTFKNEYIRTSGLRFIDICQVMGADESVYWHDGYLSDDLVHPSKLGATVLRRAMCENLPEIDY